LAGGFLNNFLRYIVIIFFCYIFLHPCPANAQDMFNLSNNGLISVNINNKPLNEVLRSLSSKFSIELKGYSVGDEAVNMRLYNISLDEMLKRMMRGYNYVLIKPESSQKYVLMVLSKAERTAVSSLPPAVASPPVQQPIAAPIPPQSLPVQDPSQGLSVPQTQVLPKGEITPSAAGTSKSADIANTIDDKSSTIPVNKSSTPQKLP
jgi:hypothetical protein